VYNPLSLVFNNKMSSFASHNIRYLDECTVNMLTILKCWCGVL
jgi:hypothetical protein